MQSTKTEQGIHVSLTPKALGFTLQGLGAHYRLILPHDTASVTVLVGGEERTFHGPDIPAQLKPLGFNVRIAQ